MNCDRPLIRTSLALCILLGGASAVAEEALGRLFSTPERRELLDRQRILNTLESQAAVEDPQLVVNGQIRRSSGKRTTWINGQAQNDDDARTGVITHPVGRGHERVIIESGDDPKTSVKIGETLNRGTQETHNPLGDGKILVRPAAGKSGTP